MVKRGNSKDYTEEELKEIDQKLRRQDFRIRKLKRSPYYFFLLVILVGFAFLAFYLAFVAFDIKDKAAHNKAILYCEVANINGRMVNLALPSFKKDLNESLHKAIDIISGLNSSLGEALEYPTLLKLQRLDELEIIDCDPPMCEPPFAGPADEFLCEQIYDIYGAQIEFDTNMEEMETFLER